jgi:putative membrane protein
MKMRLSGWGALACAAILTVSCDRTARNDRYNESAATTSRDTTASDTATPRDDSGNSSITAGTSGQTSSAQSTGARQFAEQAMAANVAEIKLGELAKSHAQNAAVKQFAQMMVTDHTKAKNELKQAVKGQGIEEPTQLDAKHQALYDKLSGLKGADFDREYITAMVDGHRDVKDMLDDRADQPGIAKGTAGRTSDNSQLDAAVNQWATRTLPAVSQHLQKAEQISKQLK